MGEKLHTFHAVAFAENLALKDLAAMLPGSRRGPHELRFSVAAGQVFAYPFGALVFQDLEPADREAELARLRQHGTLSTPMVHEELQVYENGGIGIESGVLTIDRLSAERAGVVAHVVAQSAAMEYYEKIVEQMFERTEKLNDRLEVDGTVPLRTRPLHRFIGTAIGTRSEVLAVLHLLDKPDATWDDAAMNEIYDDLRAEFDLVDRFEALEFKLRSIQEAVELILDVARDRRMFWLEIAIVALFVFEVVLSLVR